MQYSDQDQIKCLINIHTSFSLFKIWTNNCYFPAENKDA